MRPALTPGAFPFLFTNPLLLGQGSQFRRRLSRRRLDVVTVFQPSMRPSTRSPSAPTVGVGVEEHMPDRRHAGARPAAGARLVGVHADVDVDVMGVHGPQRRRNWIGRDPRSAGEPLRYLAVHVRFQEDRDPVARREGDAQKLDGRRLQVAWQGGADHEGPTPTTRKPSAILQGTAVSARSSLRRHRGVEEAALRKLIA